MPLHTKKTNNTNKLMQISYPSALTKIIKLKKKKKNFFLYRSELPEIGRYFFRYEIGELYVPVCMPIRYIPAVPTSTVWNWLPWFWPLGSGYPEDKKFHIYWRGRLLVVGKKVMSVLNGEPKWKSVKVCQLNGCEILCVYCEVFSIKWEILWT